MYQNVYNRFVRHLLLNYLIGSLIAVLGVGGILIFSTLNLSFLEIRVLLFIIFSSFMVMGLCEFVVFKRHVKEIKTILYSFNPTISECQHAFIHTNRFPLLTVLRILGSHFLGLSIPAICLVLLSIKLGWLAMPPHYVLYATIGALLIAGMHAFIEYFLTTRAIQPVLAAIQDHSKNIHRLPLSLEGDVLVSIRTKFLVSALFIGIFPVLLFSLATQVRLDALDLSSYFKDFWNWAITILLVAAAFSSFGAFLLFRDIIRPIHSLLKGMENVKENQLIPAKELYGDEFSNVMRGFNSMVEGIRERNETNRLLLESFYQTLSTALDARDPYTAGHSLRVSEYSVLIGKKARLPAEQLEQLKNSALLHDIGKIGISDDVLLKDGILTDEEFEQIKLHPVLGANILEQVLPKEAMEKLIPGLRSHHERFDGYGYPDRLFGTEIPLFGRIIAVADAFDAMTSDRPYREGMSTSKALSILQSGKGTQWDPHIVDCFLEIIKEKEEKALTASSM